MKKAESSGYYDGLSENRDTYAGDIRRVMGHTTLAMTEHYNRTNGKIIVDKEIWNRIFGSKKPDGD